MGGGEPDVGTSIDMETEDPEATAAAKRKAEEDRTENAAEGNSDGASTPKAATSSAGAGMAITMSPLEIQQRAKEESDRQERVLSQKAAAVQAKRARLRDNSSTKVDLDERATV